LRLILGLIMGLMLGLGRRVIGGRVRVDRLHGSLNQNMGRDRSRSLQGWLKLWAEMRLIRHPGLSCGVRRMGLPDRLSRLLLRRGCGSGRGSRFCNRCCLQA